jgi:uncharacterized protein (UPF0335 family)
MTLNLNDGTFNFAELDDGTGTLDPPNARLLNIATHMIHLLWPNITNENLEEILDDLKEKLDSNEEHLENDFQWLNMLDDDSLREKMYNLIISFFKADRKSGQKKYISKIKKEKWDKVKRSMLYLQIMKLLPPREDNVPDKWEELEEGEKLQTQIQSKLISDDDIDEQRIHTDTRILSAASSLAGGDNKQIGGSRNLLYINDKIKLISKVIKYKLKHIYEMFNVNIKEELSVLIDKIEYSNDKNLLNLYLKLIKEIDELLRKYNYYTYIRELINENKEDYIDDLNKITQRIEYYIAKFYSNIELGKENNNIFDELILEIDKYINKIKDPTLEKLLVKNKNYVDNYFNSTGLTIKNIKKNIYEKYEEYEDFDIDKITEITFKDIIDTYDTRAYTSNPTSPGVTINPILDDQKQNYEYFIKQKIYRYTDILKFDFFNEIEKKQFEFLERKTSGTSVSYNCTDFLKDNICTQYENLQNNELFQKCILSFVILFNEKYDDLYECLLEFFIYLNSLIYSMENLNDSDKFNQNKLHNDSKINEVITLYRKKIYFIDNYIEIIGNPSFTTVSNGHLNYFKIMSALIKLKIDLFIKKNYNKKDKYDQTSFLLNRKLDTNINKPIENMETYEGEIKKIIEEIKNIYPIFDSNIQFSDIKTVEELLKIRCLINKINIELVRIQSSTSGSLTLTVVPPVVPPVGVTPGATPGAAPLVPPVGVTPGATPGAAPLVAPLIPKDELFKCLNDNLKSIVTYKIDQSKIESQFIDKIVNSELFFRYNLITTYRILKPLIKLFFKFLTNFDETKYYFSNLYIIINSNNTLTYSSILIDTIEKCKKQNKQYCIIHLLIPNHQNLLIVNTQSLDIYHLEINGFGFCLEKQANDVAGEVKYVRDDHLLIRDWGDFNTFNQYIRDFLSNNNDNSRLAYTNSRFNIYYNLFRLFEEILPKYKYYSPFSIITQKSLVKVYEYKQGFDPEGYCVTLTFMYLYIFLYNTVSSKSDSANPIETLKLIDPSDTDTTTPKKRFIELSNLMIKICSNNYSFNIVRIFAMNLFQYYFKYLYNLTLLNYKIEISYPSSILKKNGLIGLLSDIKCDGKILDNINDQKIIFNFNHTDQKIQITYNNKHFELVETNKWTNPLLTCTEDVSLSEILRWIFFNNYYTTETQYLDNIFFIERLNKDPNTTHTLHEDYFKCNKSDNYIKKKYLKYKLKYLYNKNKLI